MSDLRRPDLSVTMRFEPEEGIADLDEHLAELKRQAAKAGFKFDPHAARNELQAATFGRRATAIARLLVSPTQRRIETDEEQYLKIITAKTAALFAAACRIAPVVAEAGEDAEIALEKYGRYLGIAFQLVDDALDYGSQQDVMGKGVGDDLRDGKVTLPVILAYGRGSEVDRSFWRAAISGERVSDEDLQHAIRLLRDSGSLDETVERARQYGRRALDAIAPFPAGRAKSALAEAVEFAISRAY